MKRPDSVDLRTRFALELPEAATALGISESTLRRVLPDLDGVVFRVNSRVLLSVEGLRRWVDQQAHEADRAAKADAEAILKHFE